MFSLTVYNLQWIKLGDQPTDMCAHGNVDLVIDDHVLSDASAGDWCVSAASIHLLRTITRSHTEDDRIAEHLIPCCGNFIVPSDEPEGDITIVGCNNGVDWDIIRYSQFLEFVLPNDHVARIDPDEWQSAVARFADEVKAFYDVSAPKTPVDDFEASGFHSMMAEWGRRRSELSSC